MSDINSISDINNMNNSLPPKADPLAATSFLPFLALMSLTGDPVKLIRSALYGELANGKSDAVVHKEIKDIIKVLDEVESRLKKDDDTD